MNKTPYCSDCRRDVSGTPYTKITTDKMGKRVKIPTTVCRDCLKTRRYMYCDSCKMYHHSERKADPIGTECKDCFESRHVECSVCSRPMGPVGTFYKKGRHLCFGCGSDGGFSDYLKSSCDKRTVSCAGSDNNLNPTMGIEWELDGGSISCSREEIRELVRGADKDYPYGGKKYNNKNKFVTVKDDGSVAIEFNFDALSANLWHQQKQRLFDMMTDLSECGFYVSDNAGIHIHVGRGFFKGKKKQENFVLFINKCRNYWSKLSLRESWQWASFLTLDRQNLWNYLDDNKYVAVNTCHNDTLEVRTFKTTLDVNRLIYYVDVIDALARFCNEKKDIIFDSDHNESEATKLFLEFIGYVKNHKPKLGMKIESEVKELLNNNGIVKQQQKIDSGEPNPMRQILSETSSFAVPDSDTDTPIHGINCHDVVSFNDREWVGSGIIEEIVPERSEDGIFDRNPLAERLLRSSRSALEIYRSTGIY